MNAIEAAVSRAHRSEKAARTFITVCGIGMALVPFLIGAFLFIKGTDTFFLFGHGVGEFLFSGEWNPSDTAEGGGQVGAAKFLAGSLVTCLLALIITLPLSISSAIFMTEIASPRTRRLIQPAIELFTGIPSVVYGFVGMGDSFRCLRLRRHDGTDSRPAQHFPHALWIFRIGSGHRAGHHDFPDDYDHGGRCHGGGTEGLARSFVRPRRYAVGNDRSRRASCG